MPVNFVEIPLNDPAYLNEHDDLDKMLLEGWRIVGHAVYVANDNEPVERYTLYRPDLVPILAKQLQAEKPELFDTPETVDAKMKQTMSFVTRVQQLTVGAS